MDEARRTALTFRYERWRAITSGMLETAANNFLLLIAVRWFSAGATAKALVAAGHSTGLLLSPVVVSLVARAQWPAAKGAARLAAVGAGAFFLMACFPVLPVFVLGSIIAMASWSSAIPLMTQVYQDNYPERSRGRMFSQTTMIRIATAVVFSEVAGVFLTGHLAGFSWLLAGFGLAMVAAWACFSQCPSQRLSEAAGSHPFRSLRYAQEDRVFRLTLICWMLMGFANLMMLPMRVEYLANPRYGLTLSPAEIAFLVGVVPNTARLILSPVWGWLFDHMNFFVMRCVLNAGFAIGILSFFTSDSVTGLIAGAIIYGISNAGGDVAWSLWVTKFSPPERVADYMSVHTFFTGVRGVLAPLVAFHVASGRSLATLGWSTAGLILLATLLLLPEIKAGTRTRPASMLVDEAAE
ncbi:MAG TPA: MFS transporter [Verrucomicrobiae bacterium]|nr:MFS transporter [Verrucomicrobiae bacterium]